MDYEEAAYAAQAAWGSINKAHRSKEMEIFEEAIGELNRHWSKYYLIWEGMTFLPRPCSDDHKIPVCANGHRPCQCMRPLRRAAKEGRTWKTCQSDWHHLMQAK